MEVDQGIRREPGPEGDELMPLVGSSDSASASITSEVASVSIDMRSMSCPSETRRMMACRRLLPV